MRYDAPFLVMRYGPMIGRPASALRVTVAHQAYRLVDALDWIRGEQLHQARRGWWRGVFWVCKRGEPAHKRR